MTSWRRGAAGLAVVAGAVGLLITAGLASLPPSTTTGADAPNGGRAGADQHLRVRARRRRRERPRAYAENQLGNNVGVDNPRGAFNDQAPQGCSPGTSRTSST